MFCCRLACHDTLEVPQYHRGGAGVVYLLFIWNMFCCRLACHDTLEVPQYHSLLFIWNMFCCRLACHDTLEVPQYHRGGGGSVFVVYLEHVLLSTCLPRHSRSTTVPQFVVYLEHVLLSICLPRHSRSTTVPQGGEGVVYLLFIWNMFCCRLDCHDTLEVPQYHRGGGG